MNRILIVILLSLSAIFVNAEKSPHGKDFKMDCAVCHTTTGWKTMKENGFNHNNTRFPLKGQHAFQSCKSCHNDLKFTQQDMSCTSCHKDIHEQTLGNDCEKCHNENSWIVTDVKNLHREAGFPLMGVHNSLECSSCHKNANNLKYDRMASDCFSCHKQDYYATKNPNHASLGYSLDCLSCHSQSSTQWTGAGIEHSFFPLQGGHAIDCAQCHTSGYTVKLSSDCYSCHQTDYEATNNPPHSVSGFSKDCKTCHSINSWAPASFDHDKLYFPIYSGEHQGEWTKCTDCHKNTSNYAEFTCTDCHEHSKAKMDDEHGNMRNYVYNSQNCYSCHPRGKAD